ncbi:MAG: hypothetical protein MUF42_01505 [Cytophagaceae bacterium]|jgi:hypothetical protein|nr:hypothetical protein [Cytophagaceae bacterium]
MEDALLIIIMVYLNAAVLGTVLYYNLPEKTHSKHWIFLVFCWLLPGIGILFLVKLKKMEALQGVRDFSSHVYHKALPTRREEDFFLQEESFDNLLDFEQE